MDIHEDQVISLMEHKCTQTPPGGFSSVSTKNYDVYTNPKIESVKSTVSTGPPIFVCNLNDPANLGSIYRLMGCFNMNRLNHVYTSIGRKQKVRAPPKWDDEFRKKRIEETASGCEKHVTRRLIEMKSYIDYLNKANGERLPVVAIETATSAVSLNTFKFPECCAILLGSEGRGIDPAIVKALRPGYDVFVIIPMIGPHKSMNVATALGVGLYEYRRQWPEGMAFTAN